MAFPARLPRGDSWWIGRGGRSTEMRRVHVVERDKERSREASKAETMYVDRERTGYSTTQVNITRNQQKSRDRTGHRTTHRTAGKGPEGSKERTEKLSTTQNNDTGRIRAGHTPRVVEVGRERVANSPACRSGTHGRGRGRPAERTDSQRYRDVDRSLNWLRQQIVEIKQQDKILLGQFLDLRSKIYRFHAPPRTSSVGSTVDLGSAGGDEEDEVDGAVQRGDPCAVEFRDRAMSMLTTRDVVYRHGRRRLNDI